MNDLKYYYVKYLLLQIPYKYSWCSVYSLVAITAPSGMKSVMLKSLNLVATYRSIVHKDRLLLREGIICRLTNKSSRQAQY